MFFAVFFLGGISVYDQFFLRSRLILREQTNFSINKNKRSIFMFKVETPILRNHPHEPFIMVHEINPYITWVVFHPP